MPEQHSYDYAIIRIVPNVERGECINCGVIVFSRTRKYLAATTALDRHRLRALDPRADVDEIDAHLGIIPRICAGDPEAGPIARLSQSERFHWLVAPRSAVIQVSCVHSGICVDPAGALTRLVNCMVALPEPAAQS